LSATKSGKKRSKIADFVALNMGFAWQELARSAANYL